MDVELVGFLLAASMLDVQDRTVSFDICGLPKKLHGHILVPRGVEKQPFRYLTICRCITSNTWTPILSNRELIHANYVLIKPTSICQHTYSCRELDTLRYAYAGPPYCSHLSSNNQLRGL